MHTRLKGGYGLGLLSSIWNIFSSLMFQPRDDHPIDINHMSDDLHLVDVFRQVSRQKSPEYSVTE